MFLRHLLLTFLAFFAGSAVSAGTFAFLLVIGIVPRMLRRTNFLDKVLGIETVIILGIISGNIMALWERTPVEPKLSGVAGDGILQQYGGHALAAVYGLSAGIFVGCIAVALAEILDTFPILFRRFCLEEKEPEKRLGNEPPKLKWLMFSMAFGKMIGSLYHFIVLQ